MPKEPATNPATSTSQPSDLDGYLHAVVEEDWLDGFLGQEDETRKDPQAQLAVVAAMRRHEAELGAAARRHFEHELWQAMRWVRDQYDPSRGRFSSLAFAVEKTVLRRFRREHKPENLRRELDDDRFREQARRDDGAMVNYLAHWQSRLESLQRHHAARWRVPGMPPDEVRSRLELELLAAVKNRVIEGLDYGRIGREATFIYLAKQVDKLKNRRVITEVSYGPEHDDITIFNRHAPSPETLAIHHDAELLAAEIFKNEAKLNLSRTQGRWLKALMLEARGAAATNGNFNGARAAENMGRDRAGASRMLKVLQDRIVGQYGNKEDLLP